MLAEVLAEVLAEALAELLAELLAEVLTADLQPAVLCSIAPSGDALPAPRPLELAWGLLGSLGSHCLVWSA